MGITLSGKSSADEPSRAIIGWRGESYAPYLGIIGSSVSRGPRLFIYMETHRCSCSRSVQTSRSICSNNGNPPTSPVIGPAQLAAQRLGGVDAVGAVVERHPMERRSYCNASETKM